MEYRPGWRSLRRSKQPTTAPLFARIDEAFANYLARSDKEWGLTDCVSFALMNEAGMTEALTADVHFRQAGFTALLLAD